MKFPTITLIYNRRHTASPTRKASIELRVTYNRQQKYYSTGIAVYPSQWKKGRVTSLPDSSAINQQLDKLILDVRKKTNEMIENNSFSFNSLQEFLETKNMDHLTFTEFCRQRAEVRKYGKTLDSQKRYDRFLQFLLEESGIKEFNDVTEASIIEMDKLLKSKNMKPYSIWNNYHRFLNSFIIDAIDAGYLTKNPYRWININKEKSITGIGKYLSPEEFHRIKTTQMPTESLTKVKDLFIFQTYTCLSYCDLKNFNITNISEVNGVKVYRNTRGKTNKPFIIPLLKPALDILDKYNSKLPLISNVKYNEYLKVVAQVCHIDKPISSHWARHTGATLLLNAGIDMGIISKVCGHSSIRITEQVYAKLLDETVVDAIKKVNI
jgi:integrase